MSTFEDFLNDEPLEMDQPLTPSEVEVAISEASTICNTWGFQFAMVGSALFIPEPNDVDFVVLVPEKELEFQSFDQFLQVKEKEEGWEFCGDYDQDDFVWCALRKGNLNFMFTTDQTFFDNYVKAAKVVAHLKLMDYEDRIYIHRVIRDGEPA